jgi:hypothetical protein
MRPSDNPSSLAILDKRAECEVVLETLADPLYKVRRTCAMPADFMERFVLGTHTGPLTYNGEGPSQPIATGKWCKQPRFEMTVADTELIKLAASRKLYEMPAGMSALTRHGRAARRMQKLVSEFLEKD